MQYLFTVIIVIIIAIFGLWLFKKLWILDKPGNDLKNTRKPVPTLQGVFVYLALLIVLGIVYPEMFSSSLVQGFLVGGTIIVFSELLAELEYMGRITFKFPPIARFIIQILASCLALYIAGIAEYEFVIKDMVFVLPQWLLYIAFALWSVFVINAVNRIDGIYAQGNWMLTIGFFTVFALIQWVVLPYYTEFPNLETLLIVKQLALILAIISLVYTVVEIKPFGLIRDVGTMFLWFGLAYLAVVGGAKIWTIIVALSLVIFDAIWIIFYRIFILKKNPMKGDYTHIHHRLLGLGWTRGEVRAFVWIFSLLMMVLMLMQGANRWNKVIIFVIMAVLFFGVNAYLFLYKKLPCGLPEKKE